MVSDVLDRLRDLSTQLESYAGRNMAEVMTEAGSMAGLWGPNPQPLLKLRTGELVTEKELARRCEEQRKAAERQTMRGMHPVMVILDEAEALDPIF